MSIEVSIRNLYSRLVTEMNVHDTNIRAYNYTTTPDMWPPPSVIENRPK